MTVSLSSYTVFLENKHRLLQMSGISSWKKWWIHYQNPVQMNPQDLLSESDFYFNWILFSEHQSYYHFEYINNFSITALTSQISSYNF